MISSSSISCVLILGTCLFACGWQVWSFHPLASIVPRPSTLVAAWPRCALAVQSRNFVTLCEDFPGARLVPSRSSIVGEWRLGLSHGLPHARLLRVGTTRAPFWLRLRRAASLRLCVKIRALGAADKPKGVDWSWPGRIMPAKSGWRGKGQGIRTLAFSR